MNNSSPNFNTSETSATYFFGQVDIHKICVFGISFLFGLPTHSYVLWLIITGAGRGVASEFFILNLSVCEIGSSLNALFSLLSYFFSIFTLFTNFLEGLGIMGRPLFQCLICVERYLAVVHPVTFLKFKPLRYRVICCSAAWIITLGSCLCCMLTSSLFYISVCIYAIQFLLFLSIQLFCLVAVLRALKQSGPGERRREREDENHLKRRAFYLIIITTVSMVLIYVPFIISGFSVILTEHYIEELFTLGFSSYVLAGFVQPVLYLRRTGKLFHLCPQNMLM